MQKFLIIQTAFIGDVVLATGLIEKLYDHFPGAQIDFLVRKGNEGLLLGHPRLRDVLIWDKKQQKLRNWWKLLRTIRKRRYDKVINVQRFAATGLLTALSAAKETIGFDKNPFSWLFSVKVKHQLAQDERVLHEIERNNELIRHFTGNIVARPRLYPSAADEAFVQPFVQKPFITISPASVWFTKQYPAEKWVLFLNEVPLHMHIVMLGAAGDIALAESIQKATSHPSVTILCGKLTFLQSAAVMKRAVMNYVNDSAPMHFASAVNAPVTAVYCSTVPSFGFGPLSDMRFIVQKEEPLYCRPCGLHGHRQCPEGHFRCAYEIREEQLLKKMK